jgi:hypothetical protein
MVEPLADQMVDLSRKAFLHLLFFFHPLSPPEKNAVGKPTPRPAVFHRAETADAARRYYPQKKVGRRLQLFLKNVRANS